MGYSVEVSSNITNVETRKEGFETVCTSYQWFTTEGEAKAYAQREANYLRRPTRYRWMHDDWQQRLNFAPGPYVTVEPERSLA